MATEFELVRVEELARLRAAEAKCADLERDLDVAWQEREMWKRRADEAELVLSAVRGAAEDMAARESDEPALTMHIDEARPHDSLVWAIYHASTWAESGPHATGSQLADILLERWRSRWPEEAL